MTRFTPSLRIAAAALVLLVAASLPHPLLAAEADICGLAVVIPAAGPFPYSASPVDTTGNTNDAGDPAFPCFSKLGSPVPAGGLTHSAWYVFTPQASGTYQLDTLGSTPAGSYDTVLGLFTGSCGSLQAVSGACNDDTSGSLQSKLQVNLNAGTTYYVLVSGVGSRDFSGQTVVPSSGGILLLNVSKVGVSYPYSYIIPSTAHTATYVSDLNLTNVGSADGSFVMQFLGHGAFNDPAPPSPQPITSPTTVAAHGSVLVSDVLASAFGLNPASGPYGEILIKSTVPLLTGARTYRNAPNQPGTFGQYALGVDTSKGLLANDESGWLIGVREDATTRTNIVVFTHVPVVCAVRYDLYLGNGVQPAGSTVVRITPPSTMVQINGLANLFGTGRDYVNDAVKITPINSPGCQLGAIAYVIDGNSTTGTDDPFAIPLQK